jgi:hypothetical protein
MALRVSISAWTSDVYFPMLCRSQASHDAFSFILEGPCPRLHCNTGLECRPMWRRGGTCKKGNGEKSGLIFVGSSPDCYAT